MLCDESLIGEMQLKVSVVVKNTGAVGLPAQTAVRLEIDKEGVVTPLLDTATSDLLLPGQFEVLDLYVALPMPAPELPFVVRAIIDPDGAIDECIEDNNAGMADCIIPG